METFYLLHPNIKLKELLEVKSDVKPVLITDAKALYDSYHREGISSSVVDKRVLLEIRVMKERLEELSGSLRWMSSERQIADGLAKESARVLLASRLRHGKLKMTWDPHYVAHKKKSKAEKAAALAESTALPPLPRLVATRTEDMMEDEHPNDTNATPTIMTSSLRSMRPGRMRSCLKRMACVTLSALLRRRPEPCRAEPHGHCRPESLEELVSWFTEFFTAGSRKG